MKVRQILFFLLVSSALLLQACGATTESAVQTGVAQTLQIAELQTAASGGGGGGGGGAVASDTPQPPSAPTETPTITLTPTSSIPYVSVAEDTNCRTGPSSNYGYVTLITTGQQLVVLKIFNSANYVVIRNPSGSGDCWLWLQYATPANFAAYNLPVATQPPTPAPTATATASYIWEGNWTVSVNTYICTMVLSESGNTVSGTYTCPTYSGTVSGTLSANRRNVTGTWVAGGTGDFTWQRKTVNTNQFVGNWGGSNYWCGARAGASLPDPCLGP